MYVLVTLVFVVATIATLKTLAFHKRRYNASGDLYHALHVLAYGVTALLMVTGVVVFAILAAIKG